MNNETNGEAIFFVITTLILLITAGYLLAKNAERKRRIDQLEDWHQQAELFVQIFVRERGERAHDEVHEKLIGLALAVAEASLLVNFARETKDPNLDLYTQQSKEAYDRYSDASYASQGFFGTYIHWKIAAAKRFPKYRYVSNNPVLGDRELSLLLSTKEQKALRSQGYEVDKTGMPLA